MKNQERKIIKIIINKGKQNEQTVYLDQRIKNFQISKSLKSHNIEQQINIDEQIANSIIPFQLVLKFCQIHQYNAKSPKINLPIRSSNYREVVDKLSYQVCEKYTNLQYAAEVQSILKILKWMEFELLDQIISAAVAVNYYTGYDEKQIQDFMSKNKLNDLTPQQIELLYEQNKQLFDLLQQKTKQQFNQQKQTQNQKEQGTKVQKS